MPAGHWTVAGIAEAGEMLRRDLSRVDSFTRMELPDRRGNG